ncbi:MAG: ComF family protein [Deltaproteobacteria bacterium]|nr:ComF family protein [Deltaproteobacteria bacterium]
MFVETNDIKSVIVNIDGLIKIDGQRQICPQSLIRNSGVDISQVGFESEVSEALKYLADRYNVRVVSSFSESELRDILAFCFDPPLVVERFPALNSLEKTVLTWPISRAVVSCGTKPCESVFLCGDITTISQAQSLRLGTIFWEPESMEESDRISLLKKGPDFIVENGQQMVDVFEGQYLGYLAEVASSPRWFFGKPRKGQYVNIISFPNSESPQHAIHVGGRYFKKDDPRNRKHALSLRILDSKKRMHRHKGQFARIIGEMVLHLVGDEFDCVTRAPPKPNEAEDRMREQIEYIPRLELHGKKIGAERIRPGLLKCLREYIPQKEIGSYEARRDNVRGAFGVDGDVRGKAVVVVDDITTSGSTLMEISGLLFQEGAKRVIPMALSYHPENLTPSEEILQCPSCGSVLVPRHNNKDGSPFYGCREYFETKCNGSMKFVDGVRELNNKIELEEWEEFEDIEF